MAPTDARAGGGTITPMVGATMVGDRAFIGGLPKVPAQAIPLKSEIVSVEGKPPAEYLAEHISPYYPETRRQALRGLS